LWGLVAIGLIAPELIITGQTLWRIRGAKARHARASAPHVADDQLAPASS
jgi:hypothetical protein